MQSHPTTDELWRFRRKSLSPQNLLRISSHVKLCAQCREQLALDICVTEEDAHLSYEQKEAYIDGKLADDERVRVESHVRACTVCSAEIDHLRRFSDMLTDTSSGYDD